jgi:tricorn protease
MTNRLPTALLPVLVLALAGAPAASAQSAEGTLLLRNPDVSADHIVFVYANDLWVVGARAATRGGSPRAPRTETSPRISPDGRMVAFTGQYEGNTDVYVVRIEGGEPRRLTFHPGATWSRDGLRTAGRSSSPRGGRGIRRTTRGSSPCRWRAGFPRALPIPRGVSGSLSPDGRHIAYTFPSFWDPEWRNYRGGQAQPVWIVSLDDHELVKPPWEGSGS